MKRLLLLPLFFLGTMLSSGAERPIMHIDRAHGEGSNHPRMMRIAEDLKLETRESAQPLSESLLENTKLLYLRAPSTRFQPDEVSAVHQFVRDGGSLLLVMDESNRQSLEKTQANQLILPFGLMLTNDTPYLHNCGGLARPGEIHSSAWEVPFSGGRAVAGGTAFAHQLQPNGERGLPFAAYQTVKSGGKVVVLSEGMVTIFMGEKDAPRLSGVDRNPRETRYWGGDSYSFMQELIGWLIR